VSLLKSDSAESPGTLVTVTPLWSALVHSALSPERETWGLMEQVLLEKAGITCRVESGAQ
jgi:hypothetical protein